MQLGIQKANVRGELKRTAVKIKQAEFMLQGKQG
jgi:hypothetical protein